MIDISKHGPWAVIAGGSEGVGGSFARRLGAAGFNLVLVAHVAGPLEAAAREIRDADGVEVQTLLADLDEPACVGRIIEACAGLDVGLFVFVAANAGEIRPFIERSLEDVLKPVAISVVHQTMLTHHFARRLAARGRGGVILVGSMAGNTGTPRLSTYGAAKAYQQLLAESLWSELRPLGVDVLAMVLGPTRTPAGEHAGFVQNSDVPTQTSDEVVRHALNSLGEGPVEFPPPLAAAVAEAYQLPRRRPVEAKAAAMAAAMQAIQARGS
jgi:short-subunit dehydrogenase